jgi:hypothetical protein
MSNYNVVTVAQDKPRYEELIPRWWEWVYEEKPDANSNKGDIAFLRDDIIRDQKKIVAGVKSSLPGEYYEQEINDVKTGASIFFPVYHVHITERDPFIVGPGRCDTIERCRISAENDLSNVYRLWANISVNDGKEEPIVSNFKEHEIKFGPFKLEVKRENDLKTEEGYYLPPGSYNGVSYGTYLLLNEFKAGKYVIDFGGNATNFETRSIYTIHVV